jgi:hypothetical protein
MGTWFTTENAKTSKGEPLGYLTAIMYLAPANLAGIGNLCPASTPGCRAACLNTAGRGRFTSIQQARIRKTHRLFAGSTLAKGPLPETIDSVGREIEVLRLKAWKAGLQLAVRLNGTSDLPWYVYRGTDGRTLMENLDTVQFYDYTKVVDRALRSKACPDAFPFNYHFTLSMSEYLKPQYRDRALDMGINVAIVTRGTVAGQVNGDLHDLRFLDPPGKYVLLSPKGLAKHDSTGFVQVLPQSFR